MEQKRKCNENNTNNYLSNINSKYILTQIFDYIDENKYLNIIRYNKALQKKINIDIKYYEKLSLIEIELYPINKAIKENKDSNQTYFTIYYNKKRTNQIYMIMLPKNYGIILIKFKILLILILVMNHIIIFSLIMIIIMKLKKVILLMMIIILLK